MLEQWFADPADLVQDRARAAIWRLRGASLGSKTRIGPRCSIMRPWTLVTGVRCLFEREAYVKVTEDAARIEMGDEVFLGRGVELDISQRLIIGNHVLIAPGCFVTDHSHRHAKGTTIDSQGCDLAPVHIGDDVWLGANAVVLAGVTIGNGAIVGSGAVVTRNVDAFTIVAGVPARLVGMRE